MMKKLSPSSLSFPILFFLSISFILTNCVVIEFSGKDGDKSLATAWKNGALLNQTLNQLKPGDELVFPAGKTFWLVGGIIANNLSYVTIRIDSKLIFTDNIPTWPRTTGGQVLECLFFQSADHVILTSSEIGFLDGSGEAWWGLIGYLEYNENRPRMLSMADSKDILIENLYFKSSPYWTVWIYNVDGLEIRNSEISNRRDNYDGHNDWNLL